MAVREHRRLGLAAAGLALVVLGPVACATPERPYDAGEVSVTRYPRGGGDDLLTASVGAGGLLSPPFPQPAPLPAVTNPQDPAQLRRLAIVVNYRALVDTTEAGGFGSLYGPTVNPPVEAGPEGQIYGTEYLTFARGRDPDQNVALMVQIPDFFGTAGRPPCIVTAPSSGSRGIYGAIGTAGEWGLKKGCAVAYTDKGTGIGAHDLGADTVNLLQGQRVPASEAGDRSNFTAELSERERQAYLAVNPHRWAWKHAHSRDNPERDWGEHVLQSIDFAFWALNRQLGNRGERAFDPGNTLVIGSSVSNGGAASLRAAEKAPHGLIDGVVVSEPNVNPRSDSRFGIRQPDGKVLHRHSRPLYDYATVIDLYQGCANLPFLGDATVPLIAGTVVPNDAAFAQRRCRSLVDAGLLAAADPAEAQARVNDHGILPDQNVLAPSYWSFYAVQAVAMTYANAYAGTGVEDNLCGFSFAPASLAAPTPAASLATAPILFGVANGIPPTAGMGVINNLSPGGAIYDPVSTSPTYGSADQNLEGAACLRSLWPDAPQATSGRKASSRDRARLQDGVRQILARGRLEGTPTIILHGRDDPLIAPNHTSRAYYGLNLVSEGPGAPTRYYEVTNAQHLDAFNPFPGYSTRYIPLHHYFGEAMDLMWDHLTRGLELPASQVVRTRPRAAGSPITTDNVPDIAAEPSDDDAITFAGGVLEIPN
jgi:hydroxybutyrate-dimer hydrolase